MSSPNIFLSYRREDSAGHTGRLHDRLVANWGADRVFWDIDNIKPGQDFVDVIDSTLDKCPIVVIVIGHRWLVTERNGARRLEDPSDFHRLEIERALQRKAYVVPALVGGAQMPSVDALPPSLRALTRRNAFELTDRGFSHDAKKLIEVIDRALVVIGDKASTQLSKADAAKERMVHGPALTLVDKLLVVAIPDSARGACLSAPGL